MSDSQQTNGGTRGQSSSCLTRWHRFQRVTDRAWLDGAAQRGGCVARGFDVAMYFNTQRRCPLRAARCNGRVSNVDALAGKYIHRQLRLRQIRRVKDSTARVRVSMICSKS